VGPGDGLDDGQAQPVPARLADALPSELLERLEQAADLNRAGITGPVFRTERTACPPAVPVEISTRPRARCCRRALSARLATRLSIRLGSPRTGAARSVVSTLMPRWLAS